MVEQARVIAGTIFEDGELGGYMRFHSLPSDEKLFYIADLSGNLYRLKTEDLTLDAKCHIYSPPRSLAQHPGSDTLFACTWTKAFAINESDLRIIAKVGGVGEGSETVSFDPEGDHVVVGSALKKNSRIVDTKRWEAKGRIRTGEVMGAVAGVQGHEMVLFDGTNGRVLWIDVVGRKVTGSLLVPTYRGAIRIGNKVIIAIGVATWDSQGKPIRTIPKQNVERFRPYYQLDDLARYFEKMEIESRDETESRAEDVIPGLGNTVSEVSGIGIVDIKTRSVERVRLLWDYSKRHRFGTMQVSNSKKSIFVISRGRVSQIDLVSLEEVSTWDLDSSFSPMAVLNDGQGMLVWKEGEGRLLKIDTARNSNVAQAEVHWNRIPEPREQTSLKDRWKTPEGRERARSIFDCLASGNLGQARELAGEHSGYADFRGINLAIFGQDPPRSPISNQEFTGFDFSQAELSHTYWKACIFRSCLFKEINILAPGFFGCSFIDCTFEDFRIIQGCLMCSNNGRDGDLLNTKFANGTILDTGFSFPKVAGCSFACDIKSQDFHGAQFSDCTFTGTLSNVTFRRKYDQRAPYEEREDGVLPPENMMRNVDFSRAVFKGVWFNGSTDFSAISLPSQEGLVLMHDPEMVLKAAKEEVRSWPEKDRAYAEFVIDMWRGILKSEGSVLDIKEDAKWIEKTRRSIKKKELIESSPEGKLSKTAKETLDAQRKLMATMPEEIPWRRLAILLRELDAKQWNEQGLPSS